MILTISNYKIRTLGVVAFRGSLNKFFDTRQYYKYSELGSDLLEYGEGVRVSVSQSLNEIVYHMENSITLLL